MKSTTSPAVATENDSEVMVFEIAGPLSHAGATNLAAGRRQLDAELTPALAQSGASSLT